MTLRFDEDAVQQIEAATAWWEANRQEARGAIGEELREALTRISLQPDIGEPVRTTHLGGVRRLLRRVRYHVYYRTDGEDIEVLAFWHASRRTGPPL